MTLAGAWMFSGAPFDIARALAAEAGGGRPAGPWWQGPGVVLGTGEWGQLARLGEDAVVADLRLDNRGDLWPQLMPPERPAPVAENDALLLLLAWRRWGEACFDRLYGDMACALWDGSWHRLVLARDAMAMRPIHYARLDGAAGRGWLFSSSPSGILSDSRIGEDFDPHFLAETLSQTPHEPGRAPYRAMRRVPAGQGRVLLADGAVQDFRHWYPERLSPLHLARPADYADAVRAQLDQAVRACLPPSGSVGSELSAGLDSTTVTALAARALAESGRRLTAFTGVPAGPAARPDPRRIDDEGTLATQLVATQGNIDHQRILTGGRRPLFSICADHTLASGEMEMVSPNALWADALCHAARRQGIKVLLSASAGNISFSYTGLPLLPRLLASGNWRALWRQWRGLKRWDPQEWTWQRRLYMILGPLLPPPLVVAARRLNGRAVWSEQEFYPLNPDFARSVGIGHRGAGPMLSHVGGLVRDGHALRLDMLGDSGTSIALRRIHGIEARDPTIDRRLMELCLTIPEDQFLYDGEPRALARRVMAGLVPEAIIQERRSGRQSADWHRHYDTARGDFRAELSRMEASPLARQILDLPRLRRIIDAWPEPQAGGAAAGGWDETTQLLLTQGFGAGIFLRRFERGNGAPDSEQL